MVHLPQSINIKSRVGNFQTGLRWQEVLELVAPGLPKSLEKEFNQFLFTKDSESF